MNRVIFSHEKGMTTVNIPRNFWERWFTRPWNPFQMYKQSTAPGMYREGENIYVHPDLVEQIYKVVNRHDDAPTLKVKAVK